MLIYLLNFSLTDAMAEDRPNNCNNPPLNDVTPNGCKATKAMEHEDHVSVDLLQSSDSDTSAGEQEDFREKIRGKNEAEKFSFLNIKLNEVKKQRNELRQDLQDHKRIAKKYEKTLMQERAQNVSIRNRLHTKEQEQHTTSQKFKTQYLEEKNRRIASDKTFKMQYKTLKETHLEVVSVKDSTIKELKMVVKSLKKDVGNFEKKMKNWSRGWSSYSKQNRS